MVFWIMDHSIIRLLSTTWIPDWSVIQIPSLVRKHDLYAPYYVCNLKKLEQFGILVF